MKFRKNNLIRGWEIGKIYWGQGSFAGYQLKILKQPNDSFFNSKSNHIFVEVVGSERFGHIPRGNQQWFWDYYISRIEV